MIKAEKTIARVNGILDKAIESLQNEYKKGLRSDIPEVTEAGLNIVKLMNVAKKKRQSN